MEAWIVHRRGTTARIIIDGSQTNLIVFCDVAEPLQDRHLRVISWPIGYDILAVSGGC
jgi:hypothetical protein